MKTNIFFTLILAFALSSMVLAKSPNTAKSAQNRQAPKGNFKSEHTFDQGNVQGRYQLANEGMAVVEDEKSLDDLLGMRFEFKDRLRKQMR